MNTAPASKRDALAHEAERWRLKLDPRFPPPSAAYRAPEYDTWQKMTVPELRQLLVEKKVKIGGCKRKSDYLHRLNEWARLNVARAASVPANPSPNSRFSVPLSRPSSDGLLLVDDPRLLSSSSAPS